MAAKATKTQRVLLWAGGTALAILIARVAFADGPPAYSQALAGPPQDSALVADAPPAYSQVLGGPPEDGAVAAARDYLRGKAPVYGLRPDLADLRLNRVKRSKAADHVEFQQVVGGIPVHGALVTVHVDRQRWASPTATNRYKPAAASVGTTPTIATDAAIAGAYQVLRVDPGKLRRKATAELVVYPKGDVFHLAWSVRMATIEPLGDWEVLVDARSGAALDAFNRVRSDAYGPRGQ